MKDQAYFKCDKWIAQVRGVLLSGLMTNRSNEEEVKISFIFC